MSKVPLTSFAITEPTDSAFMTCLYGSTYALARVDISNIAGISRPAISEAAVRLQARGAIITTGVREGTRGGVATLFKINPDYCRSLAVSIESDRVQLRSTAADGSILDSRVHPLTEMMTTEEAIEQAARLVDASIASAKSPISAISISAANPVDLESGMIVDFHELASHAARFDAKAIFRREDAALTIDNDVNWATIAESAEDIHGRDFIYIFIGRGIGAGLFLEGGLRRGNRGLAGEIGSLRIDANHDLTTSLAALGLGSIAAHKLSVASEPVSSRLSGADYRQVVQVLAEQMANLAISLDPARFALSGPFANDPKFFRDLTTAFKSLSLVEIDIDHAQFDPLGGASQHAHQETLRLIGVNRP